MADKTPGGKEVAGDGETHQAILLQYGTYLMGSEASTEACLHELPKSRAPDPFASVTPVNLPYLGVQYGNQKEAGVSLAVPQSTFPPHGLNFFEGADMSYMQLMMAAELEGAIGGSQHSSQQPGSIGRGFCENDLYMLTERNGRLQDQLCEGSHVGGQTTNLQQETDLDVGADGFPSWSWDGNMNEEAGDCSHPPDFMQEDNDEDGFESDEDGFDSDEVAPLSSHGPSFAEPMNVDDGSNDNEEANPECADQTTCGNPCEETIEHLSQEDIQIFLENDSVTAAQTCSQEMLSHHMPRLNKVFLTHEDAYAFYNEYAAISGFAIKKAGTYHAAKPGGKVVTRYTFKCNRLGKVVDNDVLEDRKKKRQIRKQERTGVPATEIGKRKRKNYIEITGCQAKMVVTKKGEQWFVTAIDLEHNHELSPPDESKFLRSHKHMTEQEKLFIRTFNSVQMPTRKIMAILSFLRGGNAPYTKKYVSNVRTAINRENGKNDMVQVLDYFRNKQKVDPNFYYAFKVADNDITKVDCVFWADGYSRKMYELYGDCLSFDTTYKTNRYNLPFAPFVGITGHGLNCLFACAIVNNETVDTFVWLFATFLDCMRQKAPITVITDQDAAMKAAVPAVFKGCVHRCCLFHIMKKIQENCVRVFAKKIGFYPDFSDIIHNCLTEVEFEKLWPEMTEKYGVQKLKDFRRLWKIRKLFVPVYFKKCFFPFIHSTARSEGTNAIFKDNVGSTFSAISFLSEYERILEAMKENEKEQDSLTRTTGPSYALGTELELQAGRNYNRSIFYRFQKVIKFAIHLHIDEVDKNRRYEVYKTPMLVEKDLRRRRYVVVVDIQQENFSCVCAKFEKDGIVCPHIVKVLMHLNLALLPEKYYIDRWRPKERKDIRKLRYGVPDELTAGDEHLRYMLLSSRLNEMASDSASSNEKYMYVVGESVKIEGKLDEMSAAEETAKIQSKQTQPAPEPAVGEPHPDGYGDFLKDPDVIASKGRPQERFKTFMERLQAKNKNGCTHCGQHDHDISSCTNKHIPRSQFHKKPTKGIRSGVKSSKQKGLKQKRGEGGQKDSAGACS